MPIFPSFFVNKTGAYEIEQSLRFNGGQKLTFTPSSDSNKRTFTISFWVKTVQTETVASDGNCVYSAYTSGFGSANVYYLRRVNTRGQHYLNQGTSTGSGTFVTNGVYADPTAWYHVLVKYDYTNSTAADRMVLYINGERVPINTTVANVNADSSFNTSGTPIVIGEYANVRKLHGYLAEFHSIDGTALDPTDFGEFDNNGVWRPIKPALAEANRYSNSGYQALFDGSTSTLGPIIFNSYVTVASGLDLTAASSVGFTTSGGIAAKYIRINGTDEYTVTGGGDGPFDFSHTGPINTIELKYNGSVQFTTIRVDGSALVDPSYGDYGANGFYLKFDPTATNGIGHDHSGNGNNFTPTGFTTSGTGTDVMSDTPTTNWATLNPLATRRTATIWGGGAYADGNLIFYNTDSSFRHTLSTFQVPTGKWYAEIRPNAYGSSFGSLCGLMLESLEGSPDSGDHFVMYFQTNGNLNIEGTNETTFTTNSDVFSIAVDNTVSPVQVVVRKNDTIVGSNPYNFTANEPFSFFSRSVYGAYHSWNFGAQGFTYTPPSGYKALNTSNLPAPDIADGSQYFDIATWSGDNASSRDIPLSSSSIVPDFVWVKPRGPNNANHVLFDAVRGFGSGKGLSSDTNGVEGGSSDATYGYVSGTAAGEFTVNYATSGNLVNLSGQTYVGWAWDAGGTGSLNEAGSIDSTVSANPSAGFSIVTYTGTGANATVGHGLGVAPALVAIKNRDTIASWIVGTTAVSGGFQKFLSLDTTAAIDTRSDTFNNTNPTSTVFSLGTLAGTNNLNDDFVAYCFAEVEGYSKIGSYTGNGSTNGPFVYCGFKPAWLLIKQTNSTGNWYLIDSARATYNPAEPQLNADLASSETSYTGWGDFLSNGFKVRRTDSAWNGSGSTYIFMALAENPFGGSGVSPATAR